MEAKDEGIIIDFINAMDTISNDFQK